MKHSFCEDWEFTRHWTEAFGKGLPVPKQQAVRLPHTCREVPLHYASPADYEMVCGYRKPVSYTHLTLPTSDTV